MLDRKSIKRLDFTLIATVVLLNIISILIIGSATQVNSPTHEGYYYMQRQCIFFIVNFILMIASLKFDYRNFVNMSKQLYVFNLLLLVAVMFLGKTALGAQRWIQIGPITLQPSEFSKIIMLITLAALLEYRKDNLRKIGDLMPVAAFVLIPTLIVMKQPDLGTSLVFLAITMGMLYVAGINTKIYFGGIGLSILAMPVLWHFLHEYQKNRIRVFLNPESDPLGSGYHVIQSKIAIGSGLIWGKGLYQGTQSQLNFLPENHTDFIFAVVGEEFGLVGCGLVILLYAVLIYRALRIAATADDDFGCFMATGIVAMFAFHIFVNVGMTTGIMPVTGIPLPFMSYGVSALTTNMMAVGILLNIRMRRQKIMF